MPQFNENFSGMIRIPLFNNTKSFNGTFVSKIDKTNQYPGIVTLTPINVISFDIAVDVQGDKKVPDIFTVRKDVDTRYQATFYINPTNKFKISGSIDVENIIKFPGIFVNAKEYMPLYKGKLTIPPQNFMDGKILIKGMDMPKFPGIFINKAWRVPQYPSLVKISKYDQELNYPGLVTNKLYKDKSFKGKVSITPQNVMEGRIEITDTPINRYYGVIVKDTNTVVNQPDNNYGLERDIHFGNGITTLAQWRFNQNKDIYYRPNQEIGAMFRMYLKRALLEDSPIRIYAINTTWNEYTVTDNTKPQMTLLYTGIVKRNTIGVMDFDLGNLLAGYNKQSVFDVALAIQIDTASGTINNSRETLVNPLGLYYYYHYVPPTMRTRLHHGVVTIRLDKEKQFKGKVKILSDNADDRFKGVVHIKGTEVNKAYPGYFFLNAPKNRSPVIPGIVKVPKFDRDIKFQGIFINKLERIPKYPGFVKVPIWEVTNKYPGSLTIPSKNNEIFYPGLVTNRLDGELIAQGNVTIRLDKEINFKGLVTISRFDKEIKFPGSVNIPLRYFETFEGFVKIPLFENTEEYPGTVKVPIRYFKVSKGRIRIKKFSERKDFKGTVNILYTPFKKFKGTIKISKFDGESKYPGIVTVRLEKKPKFKGLVNVPKYDVDINIPSFVHILETHFSTARGILSIPLFDDSLQYKGIFINAVAEDIRYKGLVRVKSDRKKVRIFIM